MNKELLKVQPQELRFTFECKKQSSCSIRLANQSDHHVAFKVKTTSSEKYCVKPNAGVIKPHSKCDFTVTMQAQEVAPPDFICEDKFLIQSTIITKGTKEEHITPITFAKEDGKYIEEKKLKVILVSPSHSPILSPISRISRIRPYNTSIKSNDDLVQNSSSIAKVTNDIEVSRRNSEVVEAMKNEQFINGKHTEETRLTKDVEEMKSKLIEFESILKQENLGTNQNTRRRVISFQFLFVFVVALVSLYLGYLLHG